MHLKVFLLFLERYQADKKALLAQSTSATTFSPCSPHGFFAVASFSTQEELSVAEKMIETIRYFMADDLTLTPPTLPPRCLCTNITARYLYSTIEQGRIINPLGNDLCTHTSLRALYGLTPYCKE